MTEQKRDGLIVRLQIKDERGRVVGEVEAVSLKGLLSLAHDEELRSVRTIEQALEVLAADFTAATADERVRWREQTPESLENQVRELIRTYLTERGTLPVVAIEQPFEVDLEDPMDPARTLPRKLRGYFDLVLEDTTVIELETSAKAWPENFLVRHLQIGAYAFAWNVHHGGPCQLDVHVASTLTRNDPVLLAKTGPGLVRQA